MRTRHYRLINVLVGLLIAMSAASCAATDGNTAQRSPIRDCPPGFVLVCESREEASKGGAEEEIPPYEYCRCEQAY
ncbi:MAG: hypothetical protein R3192_12980 [Woeseiaceae bacterium]|nr:hypothetical protein [Woeseiaceae bacterium]